MADGRSPCLPRGIAALADCSRGRNAGGGAELAGDTADVDLARYERSDLGNAHRLLDRFGADMLHVDDVGWFVWSGRHWTRRRAEATVTMRAHDTARAIRQESLAVRADDPDVWGGTAAARGRADDLARWSVASGERRRTQGMLAQAAPYVSVGPDALDQGDMILNLRNGTLILEGACDQLRPHAREDHLTRVAAAAYVPEASCPRWLQFLAEVQPALDDRLFLQRLIGYCLTGLTTEQRLAFFFGEGANGKSVFVDTVAYILGDYALTLPFASLLRDDRRRGSEATPDVARLPGVRFARASEPEQGAQFSEAMIKAVTAGEEMTVRHLHRGFFEFSPRFKLILSGNHKPRIRGQDHGIWRRLILVPWSVTIPPELRDPLLAHKLREEAPGILNWALDGLRCWLEDGLQVPNRVTAATESYRQDMDPVGRFLTACVVSELGGDIQATEMYGAYCRWCAVNAERPWSQTAFGKALPDRGIDKKVTKGRVFYQDVRLENVPDVLDDSDQPPPPEDE